MAPLAGGRLHPLGSSFLPPRGEQSNTDLADLEWRARGSARAALGEGGALAQCFSAPLPAAPAQVLGGIAQHGKHGGHVSSSAGRNMLLGNLCLLINTLAMVGDGRLGCGRRVGQGIGPGYGSARHSRKANMQGHLLRLAQRGAAMCGPETLHAGPPPLTSDRLLKPSPEISTGEPFNSI